MATSNKQSTMFDMAEHRLAYAGGIGSMANSMLPAVDWKMPTSFPDLTRAKRIGLDIESYDPTLKTKGPGFVRNEAHMVGVSLAVDGWKGYYPIRHKEGPNLAPNVVFSWLKDILKTDIPKVGANLIYDLEGLKAEGVEVSGPIYDIQNAEALLDEENALFDFSEFKSEFQGSHEQCERAYHAMRGMSLDALSWKYLKKRKNEEMLKRVQDVLKLKDIKGHLHRLPAKLVGPYAEDDAALALEVLDKQLPLISKEDLGQVWKLESDLVPLLLKMRFKGVRVDLDAAEQLQKTLRIEEQALTKELTELAGRPIDPWSGPDLAKLCEANKIGYRTTSKGNPSFTADWLAAQPHPALKKVVHLRKTEKMRRDFVEGVVLETSVRGRIHCQFHQLRTDDDGARSGRFASSNPNLQQVPARDDRFGPMVRSLFIADDGSKWVCCDYSAQEPRLTVHYAHACNLRGSQAAVDKYNNDPSTDYHMFAADLAFPREADRKKARKWAKEINLGLAYGMGVRKLAWKLGYITEAQSEDRSVSIPDEVNEVLRAYHEGLPFVKPLMERATNAAANRGQIRTLLGRHRHFLLYEVKDKGEDYKAPLPESLARVVYGDSSIRRAFTHKALNALIQGSAADMIKKAMLDLAAAGYVPTLTVHDEINDSVESEKQFNEIRQIMVDAVKLAVPLKVDGKLADNWGAAK